MADQFLTNNQFLAPDSVPAEVVPTVSPPFPTRQVASPQGALAPQAPISQQPLDRFRGVTQQQQTPLQGALTTTEGLRKEIENQTAEVQQRLTRNQLDLQRRFDAVINPPFT